MDKGLVRLGAVGVALGLIVATLLPPLGVYFFVIGASMVLAGLGVLDGPKDRARRLVNPESQQLAIRGLVGAAGLLMAILAVRWLMVDKLYIALVAMPLAAAGLAYLLLGGAPTRHTSRRS